MRSRSLLLVVSLSVGCAVTTEGDPPLAEQPQSAVQSTAPSTPAYLNHAVGVFTAATVRAMQHSTYLNQAFVDVEVRTTTRPDTGSYTATYLNTRVTYFEAFEEGNSLGLPRNLIELATGTETTGSSEVIVAAWNAEFGENAPIYPVSRFIDGVAVPWFRLAVPDWTATAATVPFNIEYVPNPGASVPRTRLEERALRYQPGKLARDVQAVVFAVPADERALFGRALSAIGWQLQSRPGGFLALSPVDHGTRRAVVVVEPAPERVGLLGVVYRLNRYDHHVEQLGDAELRVGILGLPYATLWFAPHTAADDNDIVAAIAQPR